MIRQLLLSETAPASASEAPRPPAPGAAALLGAEFPSLCVRPHPGEDAETGLRLDAEAWRAPGFDPQEWDARVFEAAEQASASTGLTLHLGGAPRQALATTALEVLTRYQGLIGRRNAASEGVLFDRLLVHLRALHDLSDPLVQADHRHALDTWQWVLRLAPGADLALQVAALFHDVERPLSDTDTRLTHPAHDYLSFKDAHAARGAELAVAVLAETGVEPRVRERVRWLIRRHERPESDTALVLLNEADALSFFSLRASGFARVFTRAHTRREVAHTLARLRPTQRWRLARIRMAPHVRRLLEEAMGAPPLPEALGLRRTRRYAG
jgi:hypothetical protein